MSPYDNLAATVRAGVPGPRPTAAPDPVARVWRAWHGVSDLPPTPPLLWLGRQERLRRDWPDLARALDALPHPPAPVVRHHPRSCWLGQVHVGIAADECDGRAAYCTGGPDCDPLPHPPKEPHGEDLQHDVPDR